MGYELWMSQGQGGAKVGQYTTLTEAFEEYKKGLERQDGSYGIKLPSGEMFAPDPEIGS